LGYDFLSKNEVNNDAIERVSVIIYRREGGRLAVFAVANQNEYILKIYMFDVYYTKIGR